MVGVLVPAKTPKEIIVLLHHEIAAVVATPEVQERLTTLGFETVNSTPEELLFAGRISLEPLAYNN